MATYLLKNQLKFLEKVLGMHYADSKKRFGEKLTDVIIITEFAQLDNEVKEIFQYLF